MPYLYENERSVHFDAREPLPQNFQTPAGHFRVLHLGHIPDYGSLRWTVDTAEDLELLRQVFTRFDGRDDFNWQEILALFEREPELAKLKAGVEHKTLHAVDDRFISGKPA
jgi:spore coat polysaccharide biosynthesis protein SpsF